MANPWTVIWADLVGGGGGGGGVETPKHQELAPAHSSSPGLVLVRNNIVLKYF